jgi:nitroreductase
MDVFEAVDSRIACRQFFDKPVDPAIVKNLIARAARAASGGNLQSWNVYALTGAPLAEFKTVVRKRLASENPLHAKTEYQVYPNPMFGAYKDRREEHGVQLYGSLGIDRTDPVARLAQFNKNFEFFDAPVALFITIDRRLGPGQWADLGGYIHTLAFLARGYGLDTCPQEAWARLYDTVGAYLKLPDNEMLFCGMAIGYGDRKHKANDFRSPRADLSEFCKFYGFE